MSNKRNYFILKSCNTFRVVTLLNVDGTSKFTWAIILVNYHLIIVGTIHPKNFNSMWKP